MIQRGPPRNTSRTADESTWKVGKLGSNHASYAADYMRLLALFCACFLTPSLLGATLVVPPGYDNKEGEGGQLFLGPQRAQTIYNAENFTAAMPEGGLITGIAFRMDGPQGAPVNVVLSDFEMQLSSTASTAPVFPFPWDANTGPDVTPVFPRGNLAIRSGATPGGPNAFSIQIPFSTPFPYDPRKGNLLVDYHYAGGLGDIILDAAANRSIWLHSAPIFGADGPGYVMELTYQPIPELGATIDAIRIIGNSAQIDFTVSGKPTLVQLQGSPIVDGIFGEEPNVVMVSTSTNTVQATATISTVNRFFRVRLE